MGKEGDPQYAIKYCYLPKDQMSGVIFQYALKILWFKKGGLFIDFDRDEKSNSVHFLSKSESPFGAW